MTSELLRALIKRVKLSAKAALGPVIQQARFMKASCAMRHADCGKQAKGLFERIFGRHPAILTPRAAESIR